MNDNDSDTEEYAGDDPWMVAETEEDGKPIVYHVRQNIPEHVRISEFGHLICVVWEFEPVVGNGLAGANVAEEQAVFEDALDDFIEQGGDSEHMIVVTGNGRKEWLWYAKDPDTWIEGFSAALSEHPPFPVEIQGYDAEGWKVYNELKLALTRSGQAES